MEPPVSGCGPNGLASGQEHRCDFPSTKASKISLSTSSIKLLEQKFPKAYKLLISRDVIRTSDACLDFKCRLSILAPHHYDTSVLYDEPEFPAPINVTSFKSYPDKNRTPVECPGAQIDQWYPPQESILPPSEKKILEDAPIEPVSTEAAPSVPKRLEQQLELLDLTLRVDRAEQAEAMKGLAMLQSPEAASSTGWSWDADPCPAGMAPCLSVRSAPYSGHAYTNNDPVSCNAPPPRHPVAIRRATAVRGWAARSPFEVSLVPGAQVSITATADSDAAATAPDSEDWLFGTLSGPQGASAAGGGRSGYFPRCCVEFDDGPKWAARGTCEGGRDEVSSLSSASLSLSSDSDSDAAAVAAAAARRSGGSRRVGRIRLFQ